MRRLCAGLCHEAVRTSLVCCVRPGRICFWYIRHDGRRRVLRRAPVKRRSILVVLRRYPVYRAGPKYCPGPWCIGVGVRAGIRADMPFYPGRGVAGQPCGARVCIPRLPGP